ARPAPTPEPVVSGNQDVRSPQVSPDGRWLLYLVLPAAKPDFPAPVRLMRVPRSGGSAEPVFELRGLSFSDTSLGQPLSGSLRKGPRIFPDFRCPSQAQGSCVAAEVEQDAVVFTAFDPVQGRKNEVARVSGSPTTLFWDLSPDGSRIAYDQFTFGGDGTITV